MKRVLSAVVILAVMVLVIAFSHVPFVLNVFVALISAAALYEAMVVTKYIESKFLIVISMTFAVCIPFVHMLPELLHSAVTFSIFVYTVVVFAALLIFYKVFSFERLAVIFLLSLMIPLFFTTMVYTRSLPYGLYNLILIFIVSWLTDTGGYIFGKLFGRHKMTPRISPKKTVEGAIGGVFASVVICTCFAYIVDLFDASVEVNYILVVVFAAVGAVFAIFGDLSASLIKRNFGVKDFGHLIPGHGGVMDRFDSVMFVAPALYLAFEALPVFFRA